MFVNLRRAFTLPCVITVEALLIATAPLSLLGAAVVAALARSTRPVRSVLLVVAYAAMELSATSRIIRGVSDWDALVRDVLDVGVRVVRRILHIDVELEEGSAPVDAVQDADSVIVLARHCGPGDTLFVAWLLAVHYRLSLHVVLKSVLRVIPAVDLAADHLSLCFIGRSHGGARRGIAELAGEMKQGDGLLLFPEGGNFSHERWRNAIASLRRSGEHRLAHRARRRRHTLPPRPGGAVAALQAAPQADVLLLAHSGLGIAGRDRPWWRLPLDHTLLIRTDLLPAASVPRDEDAAREFLDRAWTVVDGWVEDRADLRVAMRAS
jgi:1-acyl-sn-glycerol-3-phosphate acyltransferase